jgi:hypothetical protein
MKDFLLTNEDADAEGTEAGRERGKRREIYTYISSLKERERERERQREREKERARKRGTALDRARLCTSSCTLPPEHTTTTSAATSLPFAKATGKWGCARAAGGGAKIRANDEGISLVVSEVDLIGPVGVAHLEHLERLLFVFCLGVQLH